MTKKERESLLEAAKAFMKIATMFGRMIPFPEHCSSEEFKKFWGSLFNDKGMFGL